VRSSRLHPLLGLRLDAREAAFPEQGLGARGAEHADRAALDFVEVRNVYALAADEDQLIGDDAGQPAALILPLGRSRQRQKPMFDYVLAMPCACTPASGRNDVAATRNRIKVRTGFPSESTEHAVEDDHGHHRQQREATATMKMSKYDCLWFSPQMASSVITAPLCAAHQGCPRQVRQCGAEFAGSGRQPALVRDGPCAPRIVHQLSKDGIEQEEREELDQVVAQSRHEDLGIGTRICASRSPICRPGSAQIGAIRTTFPPR